MTAAATAGAPPQMATINTFNFVWMAFAFAVMAAVIAIGNLWALNFLHVISGGLWTGIDLFMGFVLGPILRVMPFDARRALITRLTPKTLFIMPTLSILTTTTGWFMAKQLNFFELPWPQFGWVVAALAVVTILTIQGLGYLLPTNLRVFLEIRKEKPDGKKIGALMSNFFYVVAFQGLMQVAIIVIMARFATGV